MLKLNLCCGLEYKEGFVNIDFVETDSFGKPMKVDLLHDLTKGLPYKNGSVSEILFHEGLEHFHRLQGWELLKECHRTLCEGGVLDITVPYVFAQLKKFLFFENSSFSMNEFFNPHQGNFGYWKYHEDIFGAGTNFGDLHKTFYSPNALNILLKELKFKNVKIKTINESILVRAEK